MEPLSTRASEPSEPGFFSKSRNLLLLQLAAVVVVAWAFALAREPITDCTAEAGLTPVCEFENPGDLVVLADGRWTIVSQRPEDGDGTLVAFRPADRAKRLLWPSREEPPLRGEHGDPECSHPPRVFSPHGVDLSPEGETLAVVNHGEHETVEYFAIRWDPEGPLLGWDGCVEVPDGSRGNDLALLPGGGFLMSRMLPRNELSAGLRAMAGLDTGFVWRWSREHGWGRVSGSAGRGPNGVEVSADGGTVFVAEWLGRRIVRIAPDGARTVTPVSFRPDNLAWSADGRLLVAGQRAGFWDVLLCRFVHQGACGLPSVLTSIDPATMVEYPMVDHDPARRLGAASSVQQVGDEYWIGTFKGDRLVAWRP
jgi:hypothetical protein